MEFAHEKAKMDASKVLQSFFVVFVIAVIIVFVVKILDHTDGSVIVEDKDNPACWTSSEDILHKHTGEVKAVKCKE